MSHQQLYPDLDLKNTTSDNRLTGLWRLMKGFQRTYTVAIISLAIAAIAKTLTYLLLREFADSALQQNTQSFPIYYFALGFLALAFFEAGFTFFTGKLAARATEGTILRLRNYLFDHLQRLSFIFHDRTQTGELIQKVTSDVDAIRRFASDQGTQIGRIVVMFLSNYIALLFLDVWLAMLSVLFIPIILAVSVLFFKRLEETYDAYQDQDGVLSARLQENLAGIRVVKAFARQTFEREKFEEENYKKYKLGQKLLMMHALYWPVSDIICGTQMLFIFYMGARAAIIGDITVGTYLAFSNLIIWIIWPMRNLGRLIAQSSSGLVSYRRMADLINEKQEQVTQGQTIAPASLQGELVFKNVSFQYVADTPVLQDISFQANPGEMIALVGATGSGKTSLINLLPRFYNDIAGQIMLDGRPLAEYAPHALREQIGVVEQEPFLFSRTIRDNIIYGVKRKVSQAEVEAAARAAAVHHVIESFPEGYDTLVGEKGVTLSGGQKQRVALARTLLKDPRILILDDATSSVDTETEMQIQTALNRLMEGRTTFIIAHRIQTVMRADKILVMKEGRIVQQGKHKDLVNQPGLYREIYDIQAQIEAETEQEEINVRSVL